MKAMPAFITDKAVMSMHAGIRKRGLKKDAKLAAEGKKNWTIDDNGRDVMIEESTPLLIIWCETNLS